VHRPLQDVVEQLIIVIAIKRLLGKDEDNILLKKNLNSKRNTTLKKDKIMLILSRKEQQTQDM